MHGTTDNSAALVLQREVDRFIRFAGERSVLDASRCRRRHRRYHRSWPLLVSVADGHEDVPAALHDASEGGVGFLCQQRIAAGARVFVKLFWHEETGFRIPATVRHATPTPHGWLIGCSFDVADPQACEEAFSVPRPWYG